MDYKNFTKLKIFSGVEDIVVKDVIESSTKAVFKDGELIIYEGERVDNKGYIILSGEVKIEIGKKEIARLGIGEMFGEMGLLDGEKRKATVKSVEEVETLVIDLDDLVNMINSDENKINKEILRRMEDNLSLNN